MIFYGKKITYQALKDLIDRFATALADLGVGKGDTVALYLLNCPQYAIAYFAILKLGAKVTPISPVYTSKEVKHQLEDSEAKHVVCEDILYDNVEKAGVRLDNIILSEHRRLSPSVQEMVRKKRTGKGLRGDAGADSRTYGEGRAHLFQDLITEIPTRPPQVIMIPERTLRSSPTREGPRGFPRRPY